MAEATAMLNIARQHAYKALKSRRLPVRQARNRDWLLRRADATRLVDDGAF
jgi:hypothetical protein